MEKKKEQKKAYNKPAIKTYGPIEVITEFPSKEPS
jgi:hypothetical protein